MDTLTLDASATQHPRSRTYPCISACSHTRTPRANTQVRFIIAEKSWHRPIIGDLAKAIRCIPVARPQDSAKKGTGKVSGTEGQKTITGDGTSFESSFKPGDSIKVRFLLYLGAVRGFSLQHEGEVSFFALRGCLASASG